MSTSYDTRATGNPIPPEDANTASRLNFENEGQSSSKEQRNTNVNVFIEIDLNLGHFFDLTITADTELSFINFCGATPFVILIRDDGGGPYTLTFNTESDAGTATMLWTGTAYTVTVASQLDKITGVYAPTANEIWAVAATVYV